MNLSQTSCLYRLHYNCELTWNPMTLSYSRLQLTTETSVPAVYLQGAASRVHVGDHTISPFSEEISLTKVHPLATNHPCFFSNVYFSMSSPDVSYFRWYRSVRVLVFYSENIIGISITVSCFRSSSTLILINSFYALKNYLSIDISWVIIDQNQYAEMSMWPICLWTC